MPRYFFDLHIDARVETDDTGTEFGDLEAVRTAAQRFLPEVGYDELPKDGDRRSLVVLVKDQDGKPVYSATLSYIGLWLQRS